MQIWQLLRSCRIPAHAYCGLLQIFDLEGYDGRDLEPVTAFFELESDARKEILVDEYFTQTKSNRTLNNCSRFETLHPREEERFFARRNL